MTRLLRFVITVLSATAASTVSLSCGGGSSEPSAASVVVSPSSVQLTALGATQNLVASVIGRIGDIPNAQVTWTSSAPSVATVEGSGKSATVTARGAGTTTITATSEGRSGTVSVTVTTPPVALTVQATGTGNGVVTSAPPGINCSVTAGAAAGACAASLPSGTAVTLTATPAATHAFAGWTGACTGTAVCALNLIAAQTVTATFTAPTVTIAVSANPAAGGTVTGGGTVTVNNSVTVTATPAAGFSFVNWTEGGTAVSSNASYQFVATVNRTLVANFTSTPNAITVSASPANGGTVTGGGNYGANAPVTVTATPNSGFVFTNWTESGSVVSTNASYQFTATASRVLVANFVSSFTISVAAAPVTSGTVTGGGTYNAGTSATVTATPISGWAFSNWMENNLIVSNSATYTFTVNGNRTLTANFIQLSYLISVSANPANGGSVSGGGFYSSNGTVTVTATPAAGYRFVNWTQSGSVVSTSASYQFTATANRTLVANFTTP